MDQDIERYVAAVSPAVLEERIRALDRRVESIEEDMKEVATKEDVRDLKRTVEKKDDRSFDWLKTVVGGALAGIIVAVVVAWILPAIAAPVHH